MRKTIIIIGLLIGTLSLTAQTNSTQSKFKFSGDFRFRVEQDWDSKKSDGTYRDDRTRLRYRVRLGANYVVNDWASLGVRIRTGDPKKQQDPQLTLGDNFKEFGTLPIGFEKLFFQANYKGFFAWAGKNTFPFEKNNELFWSDNVYPEGVFLKKSIAFESNFINQLHISGGHFIIGTSGTSLDKDSYFEGFQASLSLFENNLKLFPSFYIFKNLPNIPDGANTFVFDYSIFHIGSKLLLFKKPLINFEIDYYSNLEDYKDNSEIAPNFKNENTGFVSGFSYGELKTQNDWFFKFTYSHIEQYAAVDFLAQNDWARWDYSSFDSPDGRLTNFKGVEVVSGYKLNKNMNLKLKYYLVEQLVSYGGFRETGHRIRLDLDVKF